MVKRRQPNIILILTDDQGYGPLGAHGHPFLKTPHLDQFHSDSIRFTDFHSGSTCAPTRSGLLTGHWCNSTGVWHTIGGRSLLRKNEYSLAQALKDIGYETAIFGKWHLGDEYPYRPQDRGFDVTLCHGGGGVGQQVDWWGNDYFDDTYRVNGIPEKFDGYCTDVFFRESMKFMERNLETQKPFFCYLATNAPHEPFNVERKYRELYFQKDTDTDEYSRFCGMITNIDDNFGILRQKLREWSIEEDTILIFMSDNGQIQIRECTKDEQYNSGVRGFKTSEYDGGHRIPFFIRYPTMNIGQGTNQGRDVETLASYVDVMPTLLDLVAPNFKLPENHVPFHGDSLKPILLNRSKHSQGSIDWNKRIVVTDTQRIPYPIKWRMCSVMQNKWRLVNRVELYDIQQDPGQMNNIIDQHPDVVDALINGYEAWWEICEMTQADDETPISIGAKQQNLTILHTHDMRNDSGDTVYSQSQVRTGQQCYGWWEILVEQTGHYDFELRRWPNEAGHNIREGIQGTDIDYRTQDVSPKAISNYTGGKAVNACTASLMLSGFQRWSKDITDNDKGATFCIYLKGGTRTQVRAFFSSDFGGRPADDGEAFFSSPYYIYVTFRG